MSTTQPSRGRYAVVAPGRGQMFTDDPLQAREMAAANRRAGITVHVVDTHNPGIRP